MKRSTEETKALVKQVAEKVSAGVRITKACAEVGIRPNLYHYHMSKGETLKHQTIVVSAEPPKAKITDFELKGSPEQIAEFLHHMAKRFKE